jgi:hypothetical protein
MFKVAPIIPDEFLFSKFLALPPIHVSFLIFTGWADVTV